MNHRVQKLSVKVMGEKKDALENNLSDSSNSDGWLWMY
jgi:hypothetical protein